MPVNVNENSDTPLYQREQFQKSFLTRCYWRFKDHWIIKFIPENSQRIVDIGCGEGITLQTVSKRFTKADVSGVDYLKENVAICRKYGLNVTQGDLYKLALDTASVDTVIFMEVIEHLDNPTAAIHEIHRILKPGGTLIIGFPNDSFFRLARLAIFKFKEASYDFGHLRQWTPKTLSKELVDAGFNIKNIYCLPTGLWFASLHAIIVCEK